MFIYSRQPDPRVQYIKIRATNSNIVVNITRLVTDGVRIFMSLSRALHIYRTADIDRPPIGSLSVSPVRSDSFTTVSVSVVVRRFSRLNGRRLSQVPIRFIELYFPSPCSI